MKYKNIFKVSLDEPELAGTHRIPLYVNGDNGTYFDSLGWTLSKRNQKICRQ